VGESLAVSREFALGEWNVEHLGIVALVQDDATAEVLQSGRLLIE